MKSFIVMDVLEKAQEMERTGESIIHLEIGEPDFETPKAIKDAGEEALRRGETRYTHSLGIPKLREAVCGHYQENYGLNHLEPDQILITSGTSPAFLVALSTILECGEEVILSDPHYPCYPNFVRFLGGIPKFTPVCAENAFQYEPEAIKSNFSSKTSAIIINSPANPTGSVLESERLAEIADMGFWVLSDEIYHGLVYAGRASSIMEYTNHCIVFNGFSKLYAMTGWRLGYLIVPKDLVRPMQKLLQNFFISANSVAQAAGYVALTSPDVKKDVERMRETYDVRRRFMVHRLREIGFEVLKEPIGAFYVFAGAKSFTNDSYSFAFELLEKARVGVTPGTDFGSNGEGYIRFSYANSLENISEGLQRIETYLISRSQA